MKNKVLIILGMHRSGTSLTAQWLDACGLHLGDRLLAGDFSNKKGHYEDTDFLELHKSILQENHLNETGLEGNLNNIKLTPYLSAKLKHICSLKNELHQQWGWKEPRTCLFLKEYAQILPQAKYLVVFRDLSEVRTSLVKRDINRILKNMKTMPLLARLKWTLAKRYYLKKWAALKNDNYEQTNIHYHKLLLEFLKTNAQDCVVCQLSDLHQKDNVIFEQLQNWGYQLANKSFSEVFDNKLFNKRHSALEMYNQMTVEEENLYNELKKYAI